jgi:hypothetical protein
MSRWIAHDARPQIERCCIALAVTVLIGFIPFADFLTYRSLFVTSSRGRPRLATLSD